MAGIAVTAIAIGNEAIRTGLGLQHEGEVLGAHRGLLLDHVVGAHNVPHDLAREFGLGCRVDGRRVVADEAKFTACAVGRADMFGDLAHALLDHVEHLQREGAHRAAQLAVIGNHVDRFAGIDHRHRNDTGIDRLLVAADDGLERLNHLAGHRNRVDAVVRQGRMAALAGDPDFELVARGHHRTGAHGELPYLITRPVVHAEHRFHRKLVEQAILDHLARATAALFGRLENQVDRTIEVAVLRQMLRRRQ